MSDSISRRDFLVYGGATLAGITLGEMGRRQLARADAVAAGWRNRGVETWATSVCRECPAACGVRARLIDGVPVKLEGNPLCPMSRGRLCPKGQAGLEAYFDPDRLVGPARRVGKRGQGRWEPVTWAVAVETLASHLGRAEGGAPLAVAAEEHGPCAGAWAAFWAATGARVAWTPAATASRLAPHLRALTGAEMDPIFDLEHADHVLSFGAPIVEDWLSPVWAQRSYGRFRRGGSHTRGRLVQVDFRRSLTARKADEWIPLRLDRQAALAWGIAAVLLREGRVDRTFLDQLGGDLADVASHVVTRYSPDDAAAATGVPVVTILRLARELAGGARPLVVVSAEAGPDLVDAVLALDALVGAFDRPGGIIGSATPAHGDLDDATAALGEVASGRLRPQLVAFKDASALRCLASPVDPATAFETVPFVVSFSPYLDETAIVADLLLPAPTSLESWHAIVPPPAVPVEAVALARPAVRPRLDTRDMASVLKSVAGTVGGSLAAACPWNSGESLVRTEMGRLWSERRGAPYRDPYETEWIQQLEKGGWWVAPATSDETFAAALRDAGGWVDPYVAPGRIRAALRARGGLVLAPPVTSPQTMNQEVAGGGDREYPLHLVPFTPAVVNLAGSPNQPVLFELLGQPDAAPWSVWAEIAPDTARSLSLTAGSRVRIESRYGSIEAPALAVEGLEPGTVALAFVPAVPGGRWAGLIGTDARRLWAAGAFSGTAPVRVRRV